MTLVLRVTFFFGIVYTRYPEDLEQLRGCMVYFTKPGIEEYRKFLMEIRGCKNCSNLVENPTYVFWLYAIPREVPVKDLNLPIRYSGVSPWR
ncbi:hypothetical protein [Thermococcus chitonophagus]|uniref:hypothetical protein n=1 Tax=Thermococcus chitonophagus TaxID=54262 RepID=UPI0012EED0F2|nr:hypothetical protein [Thermococcus chitonophagus]